MANKRESSSQRRQRENRARRAALEARTKGAPPARPSRVAPSTAEKLKRSAETKSSGSTRIDDATAAEVAGTDATKAKDGKKPRRVRPPRPGDTPVDPATLEGSWFSRVMHVPGGTQVLFAMVMGIVATGLMSFTPVFIAEADKDKDKAKATQTVWEAFSVGRGLLLVGIPLAITAFALWSTLKPQRRRVWLVAAIALGALSLMFLQLYIIVAGFLAYAVVRAAKVEGPNEPLLSSLLGRGRGRRRGAASGDTDDATGEDDGVADEAEAITDVESPIEGDDGADDDGPIVRRRGFFSR